MFYPVKRTTNAVCADPFAHIFEQFFGDSERGAVRSSGLAPQFDIVETESDYTVAAELPGLGKEDVDVTVDDDTLTVRGEKKAGEKQDGTSYIVRERRYGSFERRFQLPETVDQAGITARYENGVLTLALPKKPEAKKPEPRTIKIKS